jgi:uncharacterized protein DUF6471
MRLAETERELADKTTRFVKAELKRAGVTYGEIAQRLEQQGLKETRLRQPIARQSNCSATFLLATLAALDMKVMKLDYL